MNEREEGQVFRRYTDVLAVLDTLKNQRITLLSTARWIDRNDRAAVELYGDRVGYSTVLAYCMTEANETFHHWQVFAGHGFGACIVFNKRPLIDRLDQAGLLHGPVTYSIASRLGSKGPIRNERIPFLKREVFSDECEYRVIAGATDFLDPEALNVDIDLNVIRRVVFGPSIPKPLVETLEQIIRGFEGCVALDLHYSRLHDNEVWSRSLNRHVGRADALLGAGGN